MVPQGFRKPRTPREDLERAVFVRRIKELVTKEQLAEITGSSLKTVLTWYSFHRKPGDESFEKIKAWLKENDR